MRLRLTLPLTIVFGVFAGALVLFGAIHASVFFGVYLLDRVADVNFLSLTAGRPRQLPCGGEYVRWSSCVFRPIVTTHSV